MRAFYTVLLYLLTPFVLLRLLWRGLALRDYWKRWDERFGFVRPPARPVAVWVHAVSVGESLAALPLIEALVQQHGEGRVWVTTTTPTGSARIQAALGSRVCHSYAPYDLPGVVMNFLGRVQPQKVVVMETELWPNLIAALHARKIPLLIANARLSPRSRRGYARLAGFTRGVLARVTQVAAQSEADAQSFRALGAPQVSVMGNLKFEIVPLPAQITAGETLRARLGAARPVWIAASTHEGEDEAMLAAHAQVVQTLPNAALILVPRHPQRFDAVAALIGRTGLKSARRSSGKAGADTQVLLGDSMGEMFSYLAAADASFVGGSLVPVGGHNVLEPAVLAKPVLFGPHMHNFLPARDLLLHAKAAEAIRDAESLAAAVIRLFSDAALRQRMGTAGQTAVNANRGALKRLLERVEAL